MLQDIFEHLTFDDPLLNMATVLIFGIIGGELFGLIKLPKVTGWIATGIILRQFSLPGLEEDALSKFNPYNYFVLGYIAFTVGATLYISNLRNTEKRISLLLLCELLITPVLVGVALVFIGPFLGPLGYKASLLLAAIAIAGAPGTTVLVIQEARARGILTRTLLAAVGLIDMVAVAVFVFVSTFLQDEFTIFDSVGSVLVQFLVTFSVGTACAVLALLLIRTIVSPAFLGPAMVAVIFGSWGAASGFGTSGGILACTFAGIAVTNLRHDIVRSTEAYLHAIGSTLFALFYTFAGMKLDFTQVPKVAGLVALYFIARFIAKSISSFVAMHLAGVTPNVRNYLGPALLPHGGVAVGLILLIQSDPSFSDVADVVTTVGLSALAINQLIGPSMTRFCITKSGEAGQDRPRLLDFLQEHRISVDLDGESADDIVKKLASRLYATANIDMDEKEFVETVLKREHEETTCLGEGLMIPHASIPNGNEVQGVLGISSKGLNIPTPDGRPIHAALLLATPNSDRNRHLEILAAFATAITRDVNLREQLYHARSAAHAYDILHATDAEDINYFIEDALERVSEHKE